MILVDTNVISEPLRKTPDPVVIEWIDAQSLETLYLSAITVAELRFGVASLPTGKRRDRLHESMENRVLPLFTGRVLAFDLPASQAYAELMSRARAAGLAIGAADGYIAATAAATRMAVATRDAAAFEAAGIPVIDPWRQQQK
jgi:predicted nucleic acid-binding protein